MSKIRVLRKLDGSVAIIHPQPKSKGSDETENQWLERVFAKANSENLPYKDIDSSELPQDREERNAWKWDDAKEGIVIDQEKAQIMSQERLIKKEILKIKTEEYRSIAIVNLNATRSL